MRKLTLEGGSTFFPILILMKSHKIFRASIRCLLLPFVIATSGPLAAKEGNFLEDLIASPGPEIDTLDEGPSLTYSGTFSVDGDLLIGDEIRIDRYSADFSLEIEDTTLSLGYQRVQYDLDVSGEGLFDSQVSEFSNSASFGIAQKWSEAFSTSLTLSGYTGFTNFRSIWIAESFEQRFGSILGFQEPDPFGFSVSLSNTYSLPNEVDSITFDLGYSRDRISPGQSPESLPVFPFRGVEVADDTLDTITSSITGNFYITNLITTQLVARVNFVSDREVRTQLRAKAAWNPINRLTFRGEFGATIEQPEFQAFFGGLSINYQILDQLTFSAGYRVYGDTGEITTSNFNSAAPDLDTRETSASLLWSNGIHSLSASVAFFETDFGEVSFVNQQFADLFSDRDFFAIRAAYSYQF